MATTWDIEETRKALAVLTATALKKETVTSESGAADAAPASVTPLASATTSTTSASLTTGGGSTTPPSGGGSGGGSGNSKKAVREFNFMWVWAAVAVISSLSLFTIAVRTNPNLKMQEETKQNQSNNDVRIAEATGAVPPGYQVVKPVNVGGSVTTTPVQVVNTSQTGSNFSCDTPDSYSRGFENASIEILKNNYQVIVPPGCAKLEIASTSSQIDLDAKKYYFFVPDPSDVNKSWQCGDLLGDSLAKCQRFLSLDHRGKVVRVVVQNGGNVSVTSKGA